MHLMHLIPLSLLLLTIGAADAQETDLVLDRGVAAALHLPRSEGPFPAVLMLHGLGSNRDEIGGIFVDAATALADRGIASLRIDFRGFGRSAGDMGDFTLDRQAEDAAIALEMLAARADIDSDRIGVLGFSFGGAAAIELAAAQPDRIASLVTWAPVGDYGADMRASLGDAVFARAAADGIVGIDLGWRTMALKSGFFDSLATRDLARMLARYPGPFLTVNGDDDPYLRHAAGLVGAAAGTDRAAAVIPQSDHIFHVYTPSRSTAGQVVALTVSRFAQTLGAEATSPRNTSDP